MLTLNRAIRRGGLPELRSIEDHSYPSKWQPGGGHSLVQKKL